MFVKVLQYRAWVIHAGLTLIRLFNWVLGDSQWLSERHSCYDDEGHLQKEKDDDCVPIDFDDNVVDDLRPFISVICLTLIILSMILDVAIFKWRRLATLLVMAECVWQVSYSMIPTEKNNYYNMNFFVIMLIIFICLWTDEVSQIVFLGLTQLVWSLGPMYIIYTKQTIEP